MQHRQNLAINEKNRHITMVPSLASVWTDLNAIADALKLNRGRPGHLPTASQHSPASTPSQSGTVTGVHAPSPGWGGKGAVAESLRDSLKRAVENDRKCAAAAAAARGFGREAEGRGIAVESLHASNMVCDVFLLSLCSQSYVTRQQNTPFTAYGYNGSYYPETHDDARQRGAAAAANAVATSSKLDGSAVTRAIPVVAPSDCDLTQDAQ